MEHSAAIMEDAGAKIEHAIERAKNEASNDTTSGTDNREGSSRRGRQDRNQFGRNNKRKADFNDDDRLRRGGHGRGRGRGGGRDGGRHDNKRHQKGDLGRGDYFRNNLDKRQRNQEAQDKRDAGLGPAYGTQFSKEEIDADEKRPKRKVAVMIGYSGTGYKGMQISPANKTIEGDLFNAFIAAGAISKANANDPKKSSLVRCARTDKGVHAAGNMISLKLIVEDDDIVQKINDNLSPQIRVWGIERTIGSFSCYQACDSRWYEYLIPSHAFLPPHPSSWLGKKLQEFGGEGSHREAFEARQQEVKGWWERVEKEEIDPILETIDEDIRADVAKALRGEDEDSARSLDADADPAMQDEESEAWEETDSVTPSRRETVEEATETEGFVLVEKPSGDSATELQSELQAERSSATDERTQEQGSETQAADAEPNASAMSPEELERLQRLRAATKQLRKAYNRAKRRYRIPAERIARIQAALDKYVGTINYHNFTVQKSFSDPSAKRHIKSFVVNQKPILIGDGEEAGKSEWLSLKVHGQSFMMHQIRKMIGLVALLVRCGSDLATMSQSFGHSRFSIPKVPGLGLLLERPVFDSYNKLQAPKHGREPLLFSLYETELEAFKEREIYQRIFREEEERSEFARFFNHVDNFKEPHFLYVTSLGLDATKPADGRRAVEGSVQSAPKALGGEAP